MVKYVCPQSGPFSYIGTFLTDLRVRRFIVESSVFFLYVYLLTPPIGNRFHKKNTKFDSLGIVICPVKHINVIIDDFTYFFIYDDILNIK